MSTPVRLSKVEEKTSIMDQIEPVLLRYSHIILPLLLIILISLTIFLVAIVLKDVSAVESGNYYYHLKDVI